MAGKYMQRWQQRQQNELEYVWLYKQSRAVADGKLDAILHRVRVYMRCTFGVHRYKLMQLVLTLSVVSRRLEIRSFRV